MDADINALHAQRRLLVEEMDRLQDELEHSEVNPSLDEADPDVVEREKTVALLEALERRIEEIDEALAQADAGTYGVCERCGEPIDPERLKILPEATMCVTCKAAVERQRSLGAR